MIVSRSHNFVFVHIFKTAGTSIKRVLKQYDMPFWQPPVNQVLKRIGVKQFHARYFPDHLTASELIERTSLEDFQSHFSFAFVRNPWDWELSHYKYILRSKRHPDHQRVTDLRTFSEYVRWRCDGNFRRQTDFTDHRGQQVVSFIGRYENLQQDFQFVCRKVGINHRLPRLNATSKTIYQQHYDDRMTALIEQTYSCDIERFDYAFDRRPALVAC